MSGVPRWVAQGLRRPRFRSKERTRTWGTHAGVTFLEVEDVSGMRTECGMDCGWRDFEHECGRVGCGDFSEKAQVSVQGTDANLGHRGGGENLSDTVVGFELARKEK